MIDQRITVPSGRMVFGDSTTEMIDNALATMSTTMRDGYEPAVVMASPVGTKCRLSPVWSIGKRHHQFNTRHYGKVTFTLKAKVPEYYQIPLI